MSTSNADVTTEHASRYLQQLCKHWAPKFPVTFDPTHGEIELTIGKTVMDAEATALRIGLTASDATQLEQLERVVEDHIKRFAFREELVFKWVAA